jgi:hypothetical protein
MKSDHVKFRRAPETNFLIIDEKIFDEFSPYALKVYGQLRKLMSYTKQCDEIKISVKNLAALSGISERKTFDVLNELEHTHFIIQRTNIFHFRLGYTNLFNISQTYGFYKNDQTLSTPAQYAEVVDNTVQNLPPSAQYAVPTAQYAEGTAQYAYLKKQESFQEVFKKKQNKKPVNPSVFSDKESVKTHLTKIIANRKTFVEDDIIAQIVFYVGINVMFDIGVKKMNVALKLVREGKWNTPQGYNGITSQSIREKEEQEQIAKQDQIQKDAEIGRAIKMAVAKGQKFSPKELIYGKIKDDDANQGTMPKETIPDRIKTGS